MPVGTRGRVKAGRCKALYTSQHRAMGICVFPYALEVGRSFFGNVRAHLGRCIFGASLVPDAHTCPFLCVAH